MRYLLIILSLVVLSCNSEKRLYKKCVKYASYCVKSDSVTTIEHDIVYRDTTIFLTQKADTVILDNPCALLCDSLGNLKAFSRTKNDNGIVTTISTKNNRLERFYSSVFWSKNERNSKSEVKYIQSIRRHES